jgi:AcrR family transcriptional regulator
MAERVKSKRRYNSPRRREQAAATRRDILEAAQRLFEQQGYSTTTMAEIAAEAGVALKTVYVAFETKSGLLRALWHLLLRGDQDDVPVPERRWYREVVEEPDPERQLRLNARNSRMVKQRAGALLGVIRSAAPADPDIQALWSRIQTDFYDIQRAIVDALHRKKALRPDLDVARATDILWTLNHPDLWLLLVAQRGWTPEQYEQWFGDTTCSQLLAPRGREPAGGELE